MFRDRGSGYWVLGTGNTLLPTLTPTPSSGTVELWNRGTGESGNRFKQLHNYGWVLGSWCWLIAGSLNQELVTSIHENSFF
jgi:hypothetical protein